MPSSCRYPRGFAALWTVGLLAALAVAACGSEAQPTPAESTPAPKPTVRVATGNWPPYCGKDLEDNGYAIELMRTVFERAGYRAEFVFDTWVATMQRTMSGEVNAIGPLYHDEKREVNYAFSDPFPGGPLVFYKRRDRDIAFDGKMESLRPYRIAVVYAYAHSPEFDNARGLRKRQVGNDLEALRLLHMGEVDLAPFDANVAHHLLTNEMANFAKLVQPIDPPLAQRSLRVGFSRAREDSAAILDAFNAALADLKREGAIDEIRKRFGL